MAKEVILTPIATSDFNNVLEYLTFNWGMSVTDNFVARFNKVTLLLSENAGIYPFFDKPRQLQRCVVTKHNILYFRETSQLIIIYTVFDTRQDPEKLTPLI
jgi:plasmid stabilization system protein ParE